MVDLPQRRDHVLAARRGDMVRASPAALKIEAIDFDKMSLIAAFEVVWFSHFFASISALTSAGGSFPVFPTRKYTAPAACRYTSAMERTPFAGRQLL